MKSFSLALSLLRIPRLFIALLLWPFVVGVVLSIAQIGITSGFVIMANRTAAEKQKQFNDPTESRILRSYLYGSPRELGQAQVCRWRKTVYGEVAPDESCAIEPLDLVIRTNEPQLANIEPYVALYQGATRAIHVCSECQSQLMILPEVKNLNGKPQTAIFSIQAYGVYALKDALDRRISNILVQAYAERDRQKALEGTVYLQLKGLSQPIDITRAGQVMAIILNFGLMISITLFLALKAHRKVLDYFSRNEALLPLVAATGKSTFYKALWLITLSRVGCFVIASIPLTVFAYTRWIDPEVLDVFTHDVSMLCFWLLGMLSSLTAIALIASIAELKHRHSVLSFGYKYIPTLFAFVGALVWGSSLFFDTAGWECLRNITGALPIFGLSPVILSPIIQIDHNILAMHCLLSTALFVYISKKNTRWFAAHLEQL